MKISFILLLTFIFFLKNYTLHAQQATDNLDSLTGVVIHADPRLSLLASAIYKTKTNAGGKARVIRSGRGFRVQIYNGNDKNKAISRKIDFMRRYPNIRTYMTYTQPQFRVKIGDFQTRAEAQKMIQQISSLYSPVMVVPDIIVINTFNK